MPTYVYETIPQSESETPKQFEYWQSMSDKRLTKHPETGEPVRRIISGGLPIMSKKTDGDCCQSPSSCGCG